MPADLNQPVDTQVHSQSENRDYVVVIAQWRAPIGKFVLEVQTKQ